MSTGLENGSNEQPPELRALYSQVEQLLELCPNIKPMTAGATWAFQHPTFKKEYDPKQPVGSRGSLELRSGQYFKYIAEITVYNDPSLEMASITFRAVSKVDIQDMAELTFLIPASGPPLLRAEADLSNYDTPVRWELMAWGRDFGVDMGAVIEAEYYLYATHDAVPDEEIEATVLTAEQFEALQAQLDKLANPSV